MNSDLLLVPAFLLPLLLTGCPHEVAPPPVVEAVPVVPTLAPTRLAAPGPTAARPFILPEAAVGTLSNGVTVYVVENHEAPLVSVRMSFRGVGLVDPAGKEGLASMAAALMNQGAGPYNAEAWDKELRRLGTSLGISAGNDNATAELTSLKRNLAPSLDRLKDLVLTPQFDKTEWQLLSKRTEDGVKSRRSDASGTASWVLDKVVWGETYKGRKLDEASLARISIKDMAAWQRGFLTPQNCAIFVGGDVTLAEVLPMLEARLGSWKAARGAGKIPAVVAPAMPSATTLTLVDKPGASQSVIVGMGYIGRPSDPAFFPLTVANFGIGGQFMSRINLNLRENKGYTYGARSSVGYDLAGTQFSASAPVVADKTVPALVELIQELRGPANGKPITDAEVANAQGGMLMARPLKFEQPGYLLGQLEVVWSYGLPADWVSGYDARVRAVDAASAEAAWTSTVSTDHLRFVIVGDLASLQAPLTEQAKSWGWTVETRDVDAKLVSGASAK
jgi:predicted Zn-dependent peptidase